MNDLAEIVITENEIIPNHATIFEVKLRENIKLYVRLPVDLTEKEAEKIISIIKVSIAPNLTDNNNLKKKYGVE